MCANRDRRYKFHVNDLAAVSSDKSDRRSSGNRKVACYDAVTRHMAYIDAKTRSGPRLDSLGRCTCKVSATFYQYKKKILTIPIMLIVPY